MKSAHLPSLWTSLGEIRLLNDFVRGWLAEDELAAELGLAEDGEEVTELEGFGPSFAEELEELAQEIETGDGAADAS